MNLLALKIALLYCVSTTLSIAGYLCPEAPTNILPFWEKIKLPKQSIDQETLLAGFCGTNPHGFGNTSASLENPKIPLACYVASSEIIVLELPNGRFCDGMSDEALDQIVDQLAFQLADYHMSAFTIVLFNKKHNYYRKEMFHSEHSIFGAVIKKRRVQERTNFVLEKIRSEEYPNEYISCTLSDQTLDGTDCPIEILEQSFSQ